MSVCVTYWHLIKIVLIPILEACSAALIKFFDFPDVVASLAPKPIYLSWGEYEKSNFRFEVETSYSANIVKKAYG